MNGYWGKVLRIDLSRGVINESGVNEAFYKKFIGGASLGAKIIHEEVEPSVEAFSPENEIIFSVGPFQGTRLPGSAKRCVVSKSRARAGEKLVRIACITVDEHSFAGRCGLGAVGSG